MTDLHDLSELARGIPTPELPSPEVKARAKEQLMNEITSTIETSTIRQVPKRTRLGRGRTVIAGTLVTAAAVTALVVTSFGDGTGNGPAPAGAAELQKLAKVAATTDIPGAGDYYHVTMTTERDAPTASVDVFEVWVDGNGVSWSRETRDGVVVQVFKQTPGSQANGGELTITPDDKLPTDVGALKAELLTRSAGRQGTANFRLFSAASDALGSNATSPEQRASLLEVLAAIPGVEALGNVKDHQGRSGHGFRYTDTDGASWESIIDPRTSMLLGNRGADANGDNVVFFTYQPSERVQQVPQDVIDAAVDLNTTTN